MNRLLIVDDDEDVRRTLCRFFSRDDSHALFATTVQESLRLVDEDCPDVVLLDLCLPDGSGLDALTEMRKSHPDLPVIMITGFGSTDTTIEAMRRGAFEYVSKPVNYSTI